MKISKVKNWEKNEKFLQFSRFKEFSEIEWLKSFISQLLSQKECCKKLNSRLNAYFEKRMNEELKKQAEEILEIILKNRFDEPNRHLTEIGRACHEQHNQALGGVVKELKQKYL